MASLPGDLSPAQAGSMPTPILPSAPTPVKAHGQDSNNDAVKAESEASYENFVA